MRKLLIFLTFLFMVSSLFATDYYVKNGGNDGLDGESDGNAWETLAKVRGETFSPADNIYFKRESVWRGCLNIPSEGTSGNPITFGAYGSGDLPVIMGSTEAATWTLDGGSIWKASFTISGYDDPADVDKAIWFVETDDSISQGDKQAAKVNCVNEYDWYYDNGIDELYVYAATDPDTRYSSIEVPTENYIIRIQNKSYLTFEYLHIKFGYVNGTWIDGNADTDRTFQYMEVHHIGEGTFGASGWGNGIGLAHTNDTARYNTIYQCGESAIRVSAAGADRSNMLIEYNTCYDCYHSIINIHDNASHTHDNTIIRYNNVYATSDWEWDDNAATGIYVQDAATNLKIYYNIVHDLPNVANMSGIAVTDNTSGSQFIYNNVIYKCYNNITTGANVTATIKNNISFEAYNFLIQTTDDTDITCDYNCVYEGAGSFKTYTSGGGTDTSWADYRSGSGYDTNGINADPLFVNAASANFHIQVGSPCKNTGDNVGLTKDYDGVSVPQGVGYDMGVYEYLEGAVLRIREVLRIRNVLRIK